MAVLSVRFALYIFDVYIDVFDGTYDCQGNMLHGGKKMSQIYRGKRLKSIEETEKIYDENVFTFFVLINSQLLAKHFYVLLCYFMKAEDSLEKR